ncbi:MAG: hypothetical protein AB8E15_13650 [Bdellovibrionales bacterium]
MKNLIFTSLLGLLAFVGCSDNDNRFFGNEITCVDFGGPCDENRQSFYLSNYGSNLVPYPSAGGLLQGAVTNQQFANGTVPYESLDCNLGTVYGFSGNMAGQIQIYIPVLLPNQAGLACMHSGGFQIVDPNGYNNSFNYRQWYQYNSFTSFWDEFKMYGIVDGQSSINQNGNQAFLRYQNLEKKNITMTFDNVGGNNNGFFQQNFESFKSFQRNVKIPVVCEYFREQGSTQQSNCSQGYSCQQFEMIHQELGDRLGLCSR